MSDYDPLVWVWVLCDCGDPDCPEGTWVPFDPSNPDHRREVLEALGAKRDDWDADTFEDESGTVWEVWLLPAGGDDG